MSRRLYLGFVLCWYVTVNFYGVYKTFEMPMPISNGDLWLELLAKFSVLASVLVIVYFCGFTAWRIARFQNHPWNFWTSRREVVHTPTLMPFTLTLKEDTVNKLDEVTFKLSCNERPAAIKLLWAVHAAYLFKIINSPSWEQVRDLTVGDSDDSRETSGASDAFKPWFTVEDLRLREGEDGSPFDGDVTVVTPSGLDWRTLINQYKYPLAIFVLSEPVTSSRHRDPSTIMGLCAILHVKNGTISKPSTVHAQYIKLFNGQAHLLQSLYVSGPEPPVYDDEERTPQPAQSSSVGDTNLQQQPFQDVFCSVCQSLPVSRAIIPCRHVCLCARCFSKVDSCPICRGIISCYFKTRDESYMNRMDELS